MDEEKGKKCLDCGNDPCTCLEDKASEDKNSD